MRLHRDTRRVVYFNADTSLNNSLDVCARKPVERDINPRSRYLRCSGQRVPCYPQPSPCVPRACRCRCIITGFRSGKCTVAFPRRFPRKRNAQFRSSRSLVSGGRFFSRNVLSRGIRSSRISKSLLPSCR